ncbi:MAG: D-lyxose/D-mannose family sugar isomerase [Fimbriimonadales bacterium]|nr:D-lyxose/D-mannose family sugar isomerase [Fimbriimonadales bacterium]
MKRSEINGLVRSAQACFEAHGWALPPEPRWDVTDFGLGDWRRYGLVLVNLAEEPEYCEKLMYARQGMQTPTHAHRSKKEDIICRWGRLALQLWPNRPDEGGGEFELKVDGKARRFQPGEQIVLEAGSRITLTQGVYHRFWPESEECIIGEVSTANDDEHDNFFVDSNVGRFPGVEEDEPPLVRLVSDR